MLSSYDGYGRLAAEVRQINGSNSFTTNYGYDAYNRPATTTYPHNNEVLTLQYNGMGLHFLHTDALGSRRVVSTGTAGDGTRAYHAFGVTRSGSLPAGVTHGFTDQQEDAGTGLVYMHARYYDPSTGQFISRRVAITHILCSEAGCSPTCTPPAGGCPAYRRC